MKTVWDRLCPPTTTNSERACQNLFRYTVFLCQHPILIQPPSEYADKAESLRKDAKATGKRRPKKRFGRIAVKLQIAAKAYDDLAKAELPHEEIKRAVCDLSEFILELFGGTPRHKIVATISSVALNRNVSVDDVRNWLREEAVKMAKKPAKRPLPR